MMRNEFRERVEQLLQQKEINENSELSHLFRLAIQNLDRNEKYQTVMANLESRVVTLPHDASLPGT